MTEPSGLTVSVSGGVGRRRRWLPSTATSSFGCQSYFSAAGTCFAGSRCSRANTFSSFTGTIAANSFGSGYTTSDGGGGGGGGGGVPIGGTTGGTTGFTGPDWFGLLTVIRLVPFLVTWIFSVSNVTPGFGSTS